MSMRVLIADDEDSLREGLEHALAREHYEIATVRDGFAALAALARESYDLVVLDVLMPGVDGLEVCQRLRAQGDRTPILMLTARSLVSDRVAGLDAGADDYLAKPFALEELRARVRALLRRNGTAGDVLCFADLRLDTGTLEAHRGERKVELTKTELALLELFLRSPRQVLTRTVIYDRVWGYDFGPRSTALWVYVSYLRGKLEAAGEPRLIQTVRGSGYALRES
jgi:two-component system response regulator MprA